MKKRLLIIFLSILYASCYRTQVVWNNPVSFNTAISAGPSYNSLVPSLATDLSWKVSQSFSGPYIPAIHYYGNSGWVGVTPSYPSDWITWPNYNCNANPADHSCYGGTQDLYFKLDFNLPTANSLANFSVNWEMFADEKIMDVWVNGNLVWSPNGGGFSWNTPLNFRWCSLWQLLQNTIIVHVQSQIGLIGLKVTNWPTSLSIVGSPTICPGATQIYSVAPIPGATGYSWSLFNGLTGTSSSNVISVTAPLNPGPAVINVSAQSGTACLGATSKTITVLPPPVVNISPLTPTSVCLGSPVTLMANGTSTAYLWNIPSGATSPLNPLTTYPNPVGTGIYTVTGTDINGCIKKKTIAINVKPLPTIFITPNTFFVCPGIPNTLTASGGVSYTWTSIPASPTVNPLVVTLTPTQTVTVIGAGVNGCTNTSTLAFTPGSVTPVSANNVTLCTNAALCTTISASSTSGWPPTYTWQPGSINGQTATVCPTVSTIYTVTASAPNTCPGTATLAVTIVTNCCSQPTTGLTPLNSLNSAAMNGGSYFVANNITIAGGNLLNNLEILMMPGVKITIPNNTQLIAQNVHLYACGIKMWQGIEVQDGGQLGMYASSLIEDAEVAIDVPGTSLASALSQNPPLSLDQVIFNKNYIGIHIHNADPAITSFSLPLVECVFSSRDYQTFGFPNALSWPNVGVAAGGLRFANTPTTGLTPPYNLLGAPQGNIKLSYQNPPTFGTQSAHIGIKINDVGNTPAGSPNPGVVIGAMNIVTTNDPKYFNLFDGLGKGIEVTDASLTTANNTFQNMQNYQTAGVWTYGRGIQHTITGLMNGRLDLQPISTVPSTDFGNRFWNCWVAIGTESVFNVLIHHGVFRSTHNVSSGFAPGAIGAILQSNRFNYSIKHNEFNNIAYSIFLNAAGGTYDMGNGPVNGTYADNVEINQNYIGPEVASNIAVNPGTKYSYQGITLFPANPYNWNVVGACNIFSNKLDRVYNGIVVNQMDKYPVEIGGNDILVEDDLALYPSNDQSGIYVHDCLGHIVVNQNQVDGQGISNTRVKLIRLANNVSSNGAQSPVVTLNKVANAHKGFLFEGNQPNTDWLCNTLHTPMDYGFCLENGGIIGQQGNPCLESGNEYQGNWVPNVNYYTYCSGSNPNLSVLYVAGFFMAPPATHFGSPTYVSGIGNTFIEQFPNCPNGAANDCAYSNNYPSLPSQRPSGNNLTSLSTTDAEDDAVDIYPNPSNGVINIRTAYTGQTLNIKVMDVTGKVIFHKIIQSTNMDTIDLTSLKSSIYFIEIQNSENKTVRRKLVIE